MFRFTIRDVLWLMVVVALALGWWLDRSRTERREAMALENFYRYASMSGIDGSDRLFSEKMTPPKYHNYGR